MACIRKWRGSWVVDWRDPTGKRFIEAAEDKEAAENRLAEVIRTGKAPASKRLIFKECGDWWLENCAKSVIKESTYQEYESVLKKHVYPFIGSKPFVKVSRTMIRELIAAKKKEGLSQSTIRNIMAPVRGMFFQAMEDGTAHNNPAARIGRLNKRAKDDPTKKIDPLTREEIQTLLNTAREKIPHYYPLLLCAVRTGGRQGELISLKGMDVDFKGRFIHVQRNLSRGKISVTKNGKDRKVDMSAQLAEVLNEQLSKRRAEALRKEIEKPAEERRDAATVINAVMEDWLFQTPRTTPKAEDAVSRGGTQIDPSNLRKVFNRVLADAKLRRVRFHDLRHSFASNAASKR
jgi:integrase